MLKGQLCFFQLFLNYLDHCPALHYVYDAGFNCWGNTVLYPISHFIKMTWCQSANQRKVFQGMCSQSYRLGSQHLSSVSLLFLQHFLSNDHAVLLLRVNDKESVHIFERSCWAANVYCQIVVEMKSYKMVDLQEQDWFLVTAAEQYIAMRKFTTVQYHYCCYADR